jgi:hypothetical protein
MLAKSYFWNATNYPHAYSGTGLPDGLFSKQNRQFWYSLEALWTENFDIFNDHLVYFVAICFIAWQFGKCMGNSLKYRHLGICIVSKKSGKPCEGTYESLFEGCATALLVICFDA